MKTHLNVLVVQDNPSYYTQVQKALREPATQFTLHKALSLQECLELINRTQIDCILLELSLPDSNGLNSYLTLQLQAPKIPVIILTSIEHEMTALRAIERGAQDYLLKGQIRNAVLVRTIRHAVIRHRTQSELLNLSLIDELTQLYNRRGFLRLAEQHWTLAHRSKKNFLLILADVNGLKWINDNFGHPEGDNALVQVGRILKHSFRRSDTLARIGGDEFAIIAHEANANNTTLLRERLDKNFNDYYAQNKNLYRLSISLGISAYQEDKEITLQKLIQLADMNLYQNKKLSSLDKYKFENFDKPALK